MKATGRGISIAVAERYLKNAYSLCEQRGILDVDVDEAPTDLPFELKAIPLKFEIS